MNWIHAIRRRWSRRTPSWFIAALPREAREDSSTAEQRAYLLASVIGRAPWHVMHDLQGPATQPAQSVNRYAELPAHCSCWQAGGTCCECKSGDCPSSAGYLSRQVTRTRWQQERFGTWTAPEEPPARRAEELDHHARERRRFSERPRIDPFPSRRGRW